MKNHTKAILVLVLLSGLHLALYTIVKLVDSQPSHVPDVRFTFIGGKTLSTNELLGKPYLVVFWATSCQTCVREIPQLIELYDKFHASGLEIIAVAMPYDPPANVLTYSERMHIPYPVAIDVKADIVRAFGNVQLTPTLCAVNAAGDIVLIKSGPMDRAKLEETINNMLKSTS